MTFNDAQKQLNDKNQSQVLRYFDSLDDAAKQGLLKQIENINWNDLEKIGHTSQSQRGKFAPPPALSIDEIAANKAVYENAGLEAIKKGEVDNVTKTALIIVGDVLDSEYSLSRLYADDFSTEFRQAKK